MASELAIRPATEPLPAPRPGVGKLLTAAALRTRNSLALVTTTLIGMVALANGQPWIGMATVTLGLTAFGLLVLWDLFNPRLICEVYELDEPAGRGQLESGEPSLDEPLDWSLDDQPGGFIVAVEHHHLFASIINAHEAIRTQLVSASPMVRTAMRESYDRCTEMARLAVPLVKRGRELVDYLSRQNLEALGGEVATLESLAETSGDAGASSGFAAAARAQRAHLGACREIEGMRDQVSAQLATIRATLQLVEARLVKLSASDADLEHDAARAVDELSELLSIELGSLEAAIDESRWEVAS